VFAVRSLPATGEVRQGESRRWWRFALPWVLVSLATDFFFDIDLLLLSGHLSTADLAIFGVCTRMFSLISFGVAAVYAVTLPDIFESEANADRAGFNRKLGDANVVAVLISLAMLVIMTLAAPLALTLFGPAFLAGAAPMSVLCLALVVRSVFGPATVVLSMRDRPYASLPSIALGMATLVIANLVLVPPFGLMGAAFSALLSISIWNVALWLTALHAAGIDVSIFARIRRAPLQEAASHSA
jgi:O-antigen/teichoic acid export membrane protein